MRIVFVGAIIAIIMLLLGALLGPQTPAPALPAALAGDATWIADARQFSRLRIALTCVNLVLAPVFLWVFIQRGWSATLRRRIAELGARNQWLQVGLYATALHLGLAACALPVAFASYTLRRRYGLSDEPGLHWLVRQATQAAVAWVPFVVGAEGFYWLVRRWQHGWWLVASAAYVVFGAALVYLQPLVVTPIFFTQQPLTDAPTRERVLRLAREIGITVDDVYVIDASTQGNEGNAYFTGIGGSTRIVLYDTLLRRYSPAEIDTILAHEMGHWREWHVWKGLALSWVVAPPALFVAHELLRRILPRWGIRGASDVAGLPLLLLWATLATTATLPLQNWQSRRWETTADRIALQATGDPEAFARTFVRLGEQNLSDPSPPQIVEGLFATHPALARRVAFAWSDRP
jgi:STE24 endopeptidase